MPIEITMPQLSDTMTEGTLVKWKKKEGDAVHSGEEIADVETDKATMPMESFEDGTLASILISEGQKVAVGQILAVIATKGEDIAALKKQYANSATAAPATPAPKAEASAASTPEPAAPAPAAAPSPAPVTAKAPSGRTVVSPLARRMASELGVDLATIRGSGPKGRIVQQDIEAATRETPTEAPAKSAPPATLAPRVLAGQKHQVPLTKMRATIAQRLQISKQSLPHFYETIDIDCENVLALRGKLNDAMEKEGIRLSLADFIAKALAVTLQKHPEVNATFDGQQITQHGDVNLGIAVALPAGLIVPVLRGINLMGLKEIRQRTADLIERARLQKLRAEELSGGTFTISNLGNFGIRQFTAIINPPEVAILAIGTAEKRAVCLGSEIVPRTMMSVTLSADHRVVDGALAAEFLRTFKRLMEEPGLMLM